MSIDAAPQSPPGHRGPADHAIREQIISAASEHFKHFGYGKTTVSDLANAIGFSKAYIYKFFDSKQAIGEVICAQCLDKVSAAAQEAAVSGRTSAEKYRKFFRAIVETTANLLFHERRLYDISAHSIAEKWPSAVAYNESVLAMLRQIILEGRENGEFERKTPIDETSRAIFQVMQPFINPLMLVHNLDLVPDGASEVANLVLRSLSP